MRPFALRWLCHSDPFEECFEVWWFAVHEESDAEDFGGEPEEEEYGDDIDQDHCGDLPCWGRIG